MGTGIRWAVLGKGYDSEAAYRIGLWGAGVPDRRRPEMDDQGPMEHLERA